MATSSVHNVGRNDLHDGLSMTSLVAVNKKELRKSAPFRLI